MGVIPCQVVWWPCRHRLRISKYGIEKTQHFTTTAALGLQEVDQFIWNCPSQL